MPLPPLPNFLFQRDPSCWIFDGVTINPMTKPARKPETMIMETIYRFHPMFAAEKFPIWLGGAEEEWGRCHVEGGDVQPIGNGTVMIGMGERTTPQAVLWIARSLFRAGSARQVLAVHLPKSRSYTHLDTVIKRKEYERQMRLLHGELVAMQEWVKASGAKICIVFEGRDTAGKGTQMYIQRYIPHFPAAGEVVIFDRSWYNRAGVERVMGFCAPDETDRFLALVPGVEKAMTDDGIVLLKYWLEVGQDEQTRRLESRIHDPRKIWKLSDMDLKSYRRWSDYSRARDAMFAATDTDWAPWYLAHSDDKRRARLNIISHLLSQIPYKPLPARDVTLPKRQRRGGYTEPDLPLRYIPTPF
jgi:polyphosphate kinase